MKLRNKIAIGGIQFFARHVATPQFSTKYRYAFCFGTDILEQAIAERKAGNTGNIRLEVVVTEADIQLVQKDSEA